MTADKMRLLGRKFAESANAPIVVSINLYTKTLLYLRCNELTPLFGFSSGFKSNNLSKILLVKTYIVNNIVAEE